MLHRTPQRKRQNYSLRHRAVSVFASIVSSDHSQLYQSGRDNPTTHRNGFDRWWFKCGPKEQTQSSAHTIKSSVNLSSQLSSPSWSSGFHCGSLFFYSACIWWRRCHEMLSFSHVSSLLLEHNQPVNIGRKSCIKKKNKIRKFLAKGNEKLLLVSGVETPPCPYSPYTSWRRRNS